MRIPGIGRFNKKLSIYFGKSRKAGFEKYIRKKEFRDKLSIKLQSKKQVKMELVTFTNSKNFPDLLLSILSFVSSMGLPLRWTIYADDEFSNAQKDILTEFKFIDYLPWHTNVTKPDYQKYNDKWQCRKYLSFSTHVFTNTTIFLDSDVVFYKQFTKYREYINEANWYLAEPTDAFSIDAAIISRSDYKLNMFIINSGFMIFNHIPPWNVGLGFLDECITKKSVTHFTEQSAVNIMYVNDLSAKILEPRVFHVSTDDHFSVGFIKTDELAIRHYVGPIRFKMWQAGWKQFI